MREIQLSDGSSWQLETVQEHVPPGDRHRRARERRTYVWVRCIGPQLEFRLMFAATWELWAEAALAGVVEAELARLAAAARRRSHGPLAGGESGSHEGAAPL